MKLVQTHQHSLSFRKPPAPLPMQTSVAPDMLPVLESPCRLAHDSPPSSLPDSSVDRSGEALTGPVSSTVTLSLRSLFVSTCSSETHELEL